MLSIFHCALTTLISRLKPLGLALSVLLAALSLSPLSYADEAAPPAPQNLQQLDQALAKIFQEDGVPGAAVALIENGERVFTKGYGLSDTAHKTPVTADTVFRAASISKSLTGIALMTAVESGQLRLDGKLAELAPGLHFNNPWEATTPVRLVHLLEHTTGWPDISFRVLTESQPDWSLARGVAFSSADFSSRWPPGRFAVYNNAGPAVAGLILEKASGRAFNDYMRTRVLRPMGMKTADFALTPVLAKRVAKSYLADGREAPYQHIVLGPSGSLATSVTELAQLVRLFLGRGSVDGQQILTTQSIERIERGESSLAARAGLSKASYGLGNTPAFDKGLSFRGHNGAIDAFTSVYGYTLHNNSGYVLMANGGEGVDFSGKAARLLQSYLTRQSPPTMAASVAVPQSTLTRYVGLYRRISPDKAFTRPFQELLGLTRVTADNGQLNIGGKAYLPSSPQLFRRVDRDVANVAFVEDGGEIYKISANGATVKEPLWRAIMIAVVLGIMALSAVISLLLTPVWLIGLFRRQTRDRLRQRGGVLLRVLPLLTLTTLVLSFALPFSVFASGDIAATRALATPGWFSITVFLLSLLFPLLSAFGLMKALRTKAAGVLLRLFVGISALAMLIFSAYAASIGWVGVQTWLM